MKRFILLTGCFLAIVFLSFGQNKSKPSKETKRLEDKIEQYWFVLIKTGPKQDFDSATKADLFKGHMANINRLYYEGVLKVAGPFGKNGLDWRGIFIFDPTVTGCKTKAEVEKIVQSDPAVTAGLFNVEIVPWYSSPIGSLNTKNQKSLIN